MENWVIVLISNEPYINKALNSIKEIRSVGQWVDDIVLLVYENLYNNCPKLKKIILRFHLIFSSGKVKTSRATFERNLTKRKDENCCQNNCSIFEACFVETYTNKSYKNSKYEL